MSSNEKRTTLFEVKKEKPFKIKATNCRHQLGTKAQDVEFYVYSVFLRRDPH